MNYYHDKTGRRTYYVELPTPETIARKAALVLNGGDNREISLVLGIAQVHPRDPYVKSIGREVAKSKAEKISAKLDSFSTDSRGIITATLVKDKVKMFVTAKLGGDTRLHMVYLGKYGW